MYLIQPVTVISTSSKIKTCVHRRMRSFFIPLWFMISATIIFNSTAFSPAATTVRSSLCASSLKAVETVNIKTSAVELRFTEFSAKSEPPLKVVEGKEDDVPTPRVTKREHEPVILLHGLLGCKRNFNTLGSALATQLRKRRRVFAVDLRNHGDNNHDWRDEMGYDDMAEDLLFFMDRMRFETAVLIGHSMGGKCAQALSLLNPNRVSGLVILDIAPVRYTEEDGSWRAVKSIIENLAGVNIHPNCTKKDIDNELRKTIDDPALRAFVLTNLEHVTSGENEKRTLRWKINLDVIHKRLDSIAGFDLNESRELNYAGDTFFIHGGASRFVRAKHMETIAKYFPNHMLTTIRGAGHWVHAEAPEDTLALLSRYLDR